MFAAEPCSASQVLFLLSLVGSSLRDPVGLLLPSGSGALIRMKTSIQSVFALLAETLLPHAFVAELYSQAGWALPAPSGLMR